MEDFLTMFAFIKLYKATILIVIFSLYFVYHTVIGQRGILSLIDISKELDVVKQELEQVRFERVTLEHKVKLMNSASLDLDLVEQQAKQVLGVADPRENVIIIK